MINPLAYYKVGHRPLGVWVGGVLLVMEFLMQLRGIFAVHRLPVHTLIVSGPLFLIAFALLLMRRYWGMVLGVAYFVTTIYMPMFVIARLPFVEWWCALVWWFLSAAGILSLCSNRRWFDEDMPVFGYGE